MEALFKPENYSHGIMDEERDLCSSSCDYSDDAASPETSSPPLDQPTSGPLYQMSSLMEQLPFKRGLSKHFQGKSQSFTSLSDVRCLGDLAKPESKKFKYCKSYSGDLDSHRSYSTKPTSRTISKKASRGSCSTLHAKRNSFLNNRPPISPHRTSTLCNKAPLFA
ncbi:TPRXL protein [Cinnamomum micranthum f. kanehirae]|uniref:TPRXL protein n=1 Tax=Cinnamomum micranthum f. kanehirae TaxID=337451 RepID=A0A443PIA4_9MAGN|nr:TPRXL protein [Cinnamomum micranthum f. kanehirae]